MNSIQDLAMAVAQSVRDGAPFVMGEVEGYGLLTVVSGDAEVRQVEILFASHGVAYERHDAPTHVTEVLGNDAVTAFVVYEYSGDVDLAIELVKVAEERTR